MCLWEKERGGACEEYRVQLGSGEVVLFVVSTNGTEPTQVRGRGVSVWGRMEGVVIYVICCVLCLGAWHGH